MRTKEKNKDNKKEIIGKILGCLFCLIVVNGCILVAALLISYVIKMQVLCFTVAMILEFVADFIMLTVFINNYKYFEHSNYYIDVSVALITALLVVFSMIAIVRQINPQNTARLKVEGVSYRTNYKIKECFKRVDMEGLESIEGKPTYELKNLYIFGNNKKNQEGNYPNKISVIEMSEQDNNEKLLSLLGIAIFTPIRLLVPIIIKKE